MEFIFDNLLFSVMVGALLGVVVWNRIQSYRKRTKEADYNQFEEKARELVGVEKECGKLSVTEYVKQDYFDLMIDAAIDDLYSNKNLTNQAFDDIASIKKDIQSEKGSVNSRFNNTIETIISLEERLNKKINDGLHKLEMFTQEERRKMEEKLKSESNNSEKLQSTNVTLKVKWSDAKKIHDSIYYNRNSIEKWLNESKGYESWISSNQATLACWLRDIENEIAEVFFESGHDSPGSTFVIRLTLNYDGSVVRNSWHQKFSEEPQKSELMDIRTDDSYTLNDRQLCKAWCIEDLGFYLKKNPMKAEFYSSMSTEKREELLMEWSEKITSHIMKKSIKALVDSKNILIKIKQPFYLYSDGNIDFATCESLLDNHPLAPKVKEKEEKSEEVWKSDKLTLEFSNAAFSLKTNLENELQRKCKYQFETSKEGNDLLRKWSSIIMDSIKEKITRYKHIGSWKKCTVDCVLNSTGSVKILRTNVQYRDYSESRTYSDRFYVKTKDEEVLNSLENFKLWIKSHLLRVVNMKQEDFMFYHESAYKESLINSWVKRFCKQFEKELAFDNTVINKFKAGFHFCSDGSVDFPELGIETSRIKTEDKKESGYPEEYLPKEDYINEMGEIVRSPVDMEKHGWEGLDKKLKIKFTIIWKDWIGLSREQVEEKVKQRFDAYAHELQRHQRGFFTYGRYSKKDLLNFWSKFIVKSLFKESLKKSDLSPHRISNSYAIAISSDGEIEQTYFD